ncbi:hypothetical protein PG999_007827 [Apiospora kogelbergensis]|uniref:Glucose-methanol-choline oxidoreductase N-terminal domain-containing protein n=1 Tax=Apiospora kogelbergensis TaxID=1337665 RepID=A0AAW0QVM8_9PEZI
MPTISALIITTALVALASAAPSRVKTQHTELRDEYDFVIAGGGTAGLTVADRLTEAFPDIEYGDVEVTPGFFDPPGSPPPATQMNYSVPVPTLNNRTADLLIGMTVGGSSAVNGQFFDRASRLDYDDWDYLAGEVSKDVNTRWNWDSLLPYFKKSVTFVEPDKAIAQALNLTWDYEAAYGGIIPRRECAAGNKDGLCWVPASQHPWASVRSHSGQGHYRDVIEDRPNYDLLVRHKVTRVLYPDGDPAQGPPMVEVRSLRDGNVFTVRPIAEAILSAGAIHTPQILQRSGIGPQAFLRVPASISSPIYLGLATTFRITRQSDLA